MTTMRIRKVGNATTVTIPKELGVPVGQEYFVYKGADDISVLAPRLPDPFSGMITSA